MSFSASVVQAPLISDTWQVILMMLGVGLGWGSSVMPYTRR